MARDDSDLEQLSTRLQQCLGRIEEEAFRLQASDEEPFDFGEVDRLEQATETLHDLVGSLLDAEDGPCDEADVNAVVSEVASARLQHVQVPLVQRLLLATGDTRVAVSRAALTTAVSRALTMALGELLAGGQLTLSTRREPGAVVVEIEALGCRTGAGLAERAETLREFVRQLGGACTVQSDQDDLFLVLELPRVIATEPSDRG